MPEPEQQRPRTLLIVVSLTLALCIPAGACVIDYLGKFSMYSHGLAIAREVDAEVSRRGLRCTEDSTLVVPDGASNPDEFPRRHRFIVSFSLLQSGRSSSGPGAEVRLAGIQPSVPWLEGLREGEVMMLRLRCRQEMVVWCIEGNDVTQLFHGGLLKSCPAEPPPPPVAALCPTSEQRRFAGTHEPCARARFSMSSIRSRRSPWRQA